MAGANEILIRLGVTGGTQVIGVFNNLSMAAGRLRTVLGALAGIAGVGVLAEFTRQAINTADEMGKLSQKTGILTEELSALSYAAKIGDLDQQEFALALKFLGQEMTQTGVKGKGLKDRLFEIADQFAQMPDGVAKNEIALKNFGKAGLNMVPFLNQGSEAIKRQAAEAERFGLIISDRFAGNADRFNDNVDRMKAIVQGLFLALAEKLLPTLIELQEKFIEFFGTVENREGVIRALMQVIKQTAIVSLSLAQAWQQLSIFAEAVFMSFMTMDNEATMEEFTQQSEKAWESYNQLLQTLERIGDEQDDVTESTKKLTSAYVVLGSRMDSLKSWLGDEKTRFATDSAGKFMSADRARVLKDDLQAQLDIIQKMKAELGPDPDKAFNAGRMNESDQLVRSQKGIEYQAKLNELLREEAEINQDRIKINEDLLKSQEQYAQGYSNFFGNLAATAKAFGKKAFVAWKAFAIAQGIVDTYKAAISAFASGTAIGTPALGAVFAAAAVAAGLANVAIIASTNPQGYAAGGYTGDGPRYAVAGPAHRGEFIFSQPDVERFGLPALEQFRATGRGVASGDVNVSFGIINSRSDLRQWLMTDNGARKIVVDLINGSKRELGIRA